MGLVETEAIILHTFKLDEADKIAVCMTEKAGLVRGVARGSRRLKSKFGASLEPFTLINLTYFEKEGRELVTIKSTEILRSYFDVVDNSTCIESMAYMVDLVEEFANPHLADEKLFRMLRACVGSIASDYDNAHAILTYCELWILTLTGFLPDLDICGGCGGRISNNVFQNAYITNEGIVWCKQCYQGEGLFLHVDVYKLLSSIRRLRPNNWAESFKKATTNNQQTISSTTSGLIKRVLEKDVRRPHRNLTSKLQPVFNE